MGREKRAAAIDKSAFLWNLLGGILSAFQSVVMLMILTRVCDTATAGVFSIAYANANVFLNVGKFGVRNYQASDFQERFTLRTYFYVRVLTTMGMILSGVIFLFFSAQNLHYEMTKSLVILVMLLFKAADSFEDVFVGHSQQHGRLDVGAKALSVRFASNIILFGAVLVVSENLLTSLLVSTVYSLVYVLLEPIWMRTRHGLIQFGETSKREMSRLIVECVPLFIATFLILYIGNAPKYAIDAQLNDVSQAYYGYISMPVLIINLLSSFIYNPILPKLAELWNKCRIDMFISMFSRQLIYIMLVTLACDLGAFFIGAPVLGALYNADLSPYVFDLIVLLSGGGFMAAASLFTLGITIMRQQESLIWGYLVVSIIALLASNPIVSASGISGASWLYFSLMAMLSVWFGVIFLRGILNKKRNFHES